MALRIRRGTDSERLTIVPVEGELIYATDTKKLYIGDGTTTGGNLLANDIQGTAAGDIYLGINEILGNGLTINGADGSVTATRLQGDLKGSVFADDSTMIIDEVLGAVVGPIKVNLSDVNIYGGNAGQVLTTNGSGVLSWSTPSGGGGFTGTHFTGDVQGSVFADDSTKIIDGITGNISASKINTSIINTSNDLNISTYSGINISSETPNTAKFISIYNNGSDIPSFSLHAGRGTINNSETLQSGDSGTILKFTTGATGEIDKSIVNFIPMLDLTAVVTDSAPASSLIILTNAGDGSGEYIGNYRIFSFNSNGSLGSKIIHYSPLNTAAISGITPSAGMVIFDSDSQKYKGYVNDTGLASGGASNSTPGWINLH